jgi:CO dehydrogenase nickel-insertion accessory protein CooC1
LGAHHAAAILQAVAGTGLLLAGEIDLFGAGAMCLVGYWMRNWSREMRRSSYDRGPGQKR